MMSRAYRPRLSKDKAVAQRLQDLSVVRQISAEGTLCIPGSQATAPAAASATTTGATGATEAAPGATEAAARAAKETKAVEATPRLRGGASAGLPFTSVPIPKSKSSGSSNSSSFSRTKNLNRGSRTAAASPGTNTLAGASPAPRAAIFQLGTSSRRRSSSRRQQRDAPSASSDSCQDGWSCVSCSFLNLETAKKCKMCSTKNYQARRTCSPKVAASPAPGAATATAAPSVAAAPRNSKDPQRRRQSWGGPRERRSSPRRAQKETQEGVRDDKIKASVDDDLDAGRTCGSGGGGYGNGAAPRKRRRNSTPGCGITASGAGMGNVVLSPSPAEAGEAAENIPLQGREVDEGANEMMAGGAEATAPVSCEREAAADGSSDGHGYSDAREKSGTGCAGHPPRGIPSLSLPPRKCGKKRARTPTQVSATATVATAAGDEGATSLSPVALTHPTEPTGAVHLSMSLSGEAGLSPLEVRGCNETAEEHSVRPPARMSPGKDQPAMMPCVVPQLTADCNEGDDDSQGSALRKAITRRRSAAAEVVTPSCSSSAASMCLKPKRASSSAESGHACSATLARVTTLDFKGRHSWEVSSVVVTSRGNGSSSNTRPGAAVAAATASIVVCHSAGVSVWDLTDAEAVCTYLSPALAGVAKEAVKGSFLAVAVVGGDPAEVTPSATRAPGGNEACIVAIGRHGTDPGLPIIHVWQQQQQQQQQQQGSSPPLLPRGTGRVDGCKGSSSGAAAALGNADPAVATRPPSILTIALKKKFSKFFPPVVPTQVAPCLCVCGYAQPPAATMDVNAVDKRGDVEGGATGKHGEAGARARAGDVGIITAVIALGSKVLRVVFGVGRRDSQTFRAKTLPSNVTAEAVCTSLAPVPTNPFLVCASFPSVNAVLLWNVRDQTSLFTLPLTASSILIPVIDSAESIAMAASSVLVQTMAGNGGEGGATIADSRTGSSSRPGAAAAAAGRRLDPRLLCLLATGSMDGGSNGSDHSNRRATHGTHKTACGLFGVFCTGDNDKAGKHSCGIVSAVPLEVGPAAERGESSLLRAGETDRDRKDGEHNDHSDGDACLRCLSDGGNGVIVGVDREGKVVARNVLTGEPQVLSTPDSATITAVTANSADGGASFATMDYDRSIGILALATAGGMDPVAAATSVHLYKLCDDTELPT